MKILRFKLSGRTAFFKQPEVNKYGYYTYNNIHKVALLGIFGAVMGYGGYAVMRSQRKKKNDLLNIRYPEFYEKLRGLNISVHPCAPRGVFSKKMQVYNNSVGYASFETGGNLVVQEQWLFDPAWEIFLLLDCSEAEEIADLILSGKCVYPPYLGKNDHPADITDAVMLEGTFRGTGSGQIYSLFPSTCVNGTQMPSARMYHCREKLPYALDGTTNNYMLQNFTFTNATATWEDQQVYECDGQNVMFW